MKEGKWHLNIKLLMVWQSMALERFVSRLSRSKTERQLIPSRRQIESNAPHPSLSPSNGEREG
jgi:hypothetical protein